MNTRTYLRLTLLLAISCLLVTLASAQAPKRTSRPQPATIGLWHHYRNDSLRLLWMPVQADKWLQFSQYGYHIGRAEVITAGKHNGFVMLTTQPLKPNTAEGWEIPTPETQMAKQALYQKQLSARVDGSSLADSRDPDQQNMRQMVAMLSAFKSPLAARQLGLSFTDTRLPKGKRYLYRIWPNVPRGQKGDTAYVLVNTVGPTPAKKPPMLTTRSLEKTVMMTWPARRYANDFMLYHIERSANGTTYERLTKTPIMYSNQRVSEAFYKDSLGTNYRPYLYRLVGMTPFGEWHTASVPTLGMGRDLTPPAPPVLEKARHLGGRKVLLTWKQDPAEGDLRGFWVGRSSSLTGQFKRLTVVPLPATARTFTDFQSNADGANHYMVFAVDTAGNERPSIPVYIALADTIPPVPPTGLTGRVDTLGKKGIVTIRWKRNPEKDVQGYYVYFANDPDHEFSQVTRNMLTDSVFRDTISLRSLTKKVFYRVVAMDKSFNHSPFSAILDVKRPDIIRPVAPLITELTVADNTATLRWQPSPSNDVAEYRLYRREQDKPWVMVRAFRAADQRTYTDRQLTTGIPCDYALEVADESGLVSDRSPIRTAKALPATYLTETPQPTATWQDDRQENQIAWTFSGPPGPYRIAIYRADDKGPLHLLALVAPEPRSYADRPARPGRYAYQLKAIYANGQQTKLSPRADVKTR
ncbi:fibronectin type III domain-containing protein [Fibrella forsythiae]|uniref:Fibronectin type-III domain-containing protein n=1 Tax=Fibrella forsythiae TaxID=2817061 RepID=A0ABS3JJX4_9BACT|nr:hypothetical protein [Fibrella forsythiae]MBO0950295.1 hypothetical protein [Fibrella forsythiae]